MGFGLNAYVRRYLVSEAALRGALQAPLLVWEQAAVAPGADAPVWMGTQGGGKPVRPRAEEPLVLEVVKDPAKQNPLSMGVTVGRTENNDLVFADATVSRFHAYLQANGKGGWRLVDADSSNGTWLGTRRVVPGTPAEIPDGARLRFGDVEVTFYVPDSFLAYVRQRMGE
jgi:hypothetical protein